MIAEEVSSEPTDTPPSSPSSSSEDNETVVVNKILLVDTENITHDDYEQTSKLKV